MKTSELIKYFEDEGYKAYSKELDIDFLDRPLIGVEDENGKIIIIDTSDSIETYFGDLRFTKQQEYYKVIFEYLMTPIEEREEEKKYKLKQKGVSNRYLLWIPEIDKFTTGNSKYVNVELVFTQSEIDEMPECYTHPAVWEIADLVFFQ